MDLKRDIDFYSAYTKRQKKIQASHSSVSALPIILAVGVVAVAGSYAWLVYQNKELQTQRDELNAYLNDSTAAHSYSTVLGLQSEYRNINLYNQMVQLAHDAITDRPMFGDMLTEAVTSSVNALGTLNGISLSEDTLSLTVTFKKQLSAAECQDALVNTGRFRSVTYTGWSTEDDGYGAQFTCVLRNEVNVQ